MGQPTFGRSDRFGFALLFAPAFFWRRLHFYWDGWLRVTRRRRDRTWDSEWGYFQGFAALRRYRFLSSPKLRIASSYSLVDSAFALADKSRSLSAYTSAIVRKYRTRRSRTPSMVPPIRTATTATAII